MTVSRENVQQIGDELRPIADAHTSGRQLPDGAEGAVVNALSTLETEGDQMQKDIALSIRSTLQDSPRSVGQTAAILREFIGVGRGPIYGLQGGRKHRTRKVRRGRSVRKSRRSRR